MEMEAFKFIAQFGVPTMVLAFVMWYLIKPLVSAFIHNLEEQTKAMGSITQNMAKLTIEFEKLQSDYHEIRNDVSDLKNKIQK